MRVEGAAPCRGRLVAAGLCKGDQLTATPPKKPKKKCAQNEMIIMDPLDQIPWIKTQTQPTKRRRVTGAEVGGGHSTEQGHASAPSAASGSSADDMLTAGKLANCGESAVTDPKADAGSASPTRPTFAAGDEVRSTVSLAPLVSSFVSIVDSAS